MVFIACRLLGPNFTKRCISNFAVHKCCSKQSITAIQKTLSLTLKPASLSVQPDNFLPQRRHLLTNATSGFSAASKTISLDPRNSIVRHGRCISSSSFSSDQNTPSAQNLGNLAKDKRNNSRNDNVPEPRPYNQTITSTRSSKYHHVSRKKLKNTYTPPANDYVSYDDIKASMKKLETNRSAISIDILSEYIPKTGKFAEIMSKTPAQLVDMYGPQGSLKILRQYSDEIKEGRNAVIKQLSTDFNAQLLRVYLKKNNLLANDSKKKMILRIIRNVWSFETEASNMDLSIKSYLKKHYLKSKKNRYLSQLAAELFVVVTFDDITNSLIISGDPKKCLELESKLPQFLTSLNLFQFDVSRYGVPIALSKNQFSCINDAVFKRTGAHLDMKSSENIVKIHESSVSQFENIKNQILPLLIQNEKNVPVVLIDGKETELNIVSASSPLSNQEIRSELYENRLVNAKALGKAVLGDVSSHKLLVLRDSGARFESQRLYDYWGAHLSEFVNKAAVTSKLDSKIEYYAELGKVFMHYRPREDDTESSVGKVDGIEGFGESSLSAAKVLVDTNTIFGFFSGVPSYNWTNKQYLKEDVSNTATVVLEPLNEEWGSSEAIKCEVVLESEGNKGLGRVKEIRRIVSSSQLNTLVPDG
ncbi:hypothetical protein AYI70_g4088 [Smittium culicis]|uniref:Uncharacterized protein n=1 Tax=Smittium culicis TaxID=133412 RepID=A0A1R1Y108_9FUNG|nr:hypothetical protein AYI70_g4088 [Smittium culicis]